MPCSDDVLLESGSEPTKQANRPRRKQQDRREEATRRILESAVELICEKGMQGVTMREVGARSGYSRALTAHHYGHKEGMLVALVEQVGADIRTARKAHAPCKPGLDSVLGIVRFYLLRKDPATNQALQAMQILFSAAAGAPAPVADALERLTKESLAVIEEQLRIGIQAGEIRSDVDPAAEAMAILGLMRGLSGQFGVRFSAAEAAGARDAAIAVLKRGLRA